MEYNNSDYKIAVIELVNHFQDKYSGLSLQFLNNELVNQSVSFEDRRHTTRFKNILNKLNIPYTRNGDTFDVGTYALHTDIVPKYHRYIGRAKQGQKFTR